MKILPLAAAGLVSLTALAPMAASAQHVVTTRTVTRTHTHTGPAIGHRTHKVCRTTVRHGHRVRTCRVERY